MKYTVFAYRDKELEKFFPPMLAPQSREDTFEGIRDAAIKGKIEDLESKDAYYLGEFETSTGKFTLLDEPQLVLSLNRFIKKDVN